MTKRDNWMCLWFALLMFTLICLEAWVAGANDINSIAKIDNAISEIVRISPRHYLNNSNKRKIFAEDILRASRRHRVPSHVIISVSYMESSFRRSAVGYARQEIGLMQVHGVAANGCDLGTQFGQIDCGTKWLKKCLTDCGDLRGGLIAYATGKCTTDKISIQNRITYRIKFIEKVKMMMK